MWPPQASWSPIGTRIVSWRWLAVPDQYAGPRAFASYEDAAYAEETAGLVEVEYTARSPTGATWSLRLSPPEGHDRDAAIDSVVVERSYRPGL